MTAKNDITQDNLITKPATDAYRDGYDRIFGKKDETQSEQDRKALEVTSVQDESGRVEEAQET